MSIVHDFRVDRTPAHHQAGWRPTPPQIVDSENWYGASVKIVFADTGEAVPWNVASVNCPERCLLRYDGAYNALTREVGDFRVEWAD